MAAIQAATVVTAIKKARITHGLAMRMSRYSIGIAAMMAIVVSGF
jgi:hypothetical protein